MNPQTINAAPVTDNINIALWGPPQAGKRWMLWSFARELEAYNQKHPDFRYEIFDQYPGDSRLIPLKIEPPIGPSSGKLEDVTWTFRRFLLVADRAHRISAHVHPMRISIIPGKESVECLFNPAAFESCSTTLTRANYVVAILDPCRLDSLKKDKNEKSSRESIAQKQYWSQEEYLTVVHALLETLANNNSIRRTVAFCISKMDLVDERGTPWEILERLFGKQMYQLLQYYRSQISLDVSAATAYGVPLEQELAFTPDTSDLTVWKPINAVAPFFYLFREIEWAALHHHPPLANILGFLFNWRNEKDYIPYQFEHWQIEPEKEKI